MQARKTFRQCLDETTKEAAEAAWHRAKLASKLRHAAVAAGRQRSARRLADLKREAIRHVLRLQPTGVQVTLDDNYHVGLLSIRWPGHGKMHLPTDTDLSFVAKESSIAS